MRELIRRRGARYREPAIPDYLTRHYWWAYQSPAGARFFDHDLIVNAILLGQYRRLVRGVLDCVGERPVRRLLQVGAVYGSLTPALLRLPDAEVCLADVVPLQLERARQRCGERLGLLRARAEHLGCASGSFDLVLLFFLLHELPADARLEAVAEALRVVAPGGRVVIADYRGDGSGAQLRGLRRWLCRAEPFLRDYLSEHPRTLFCRAGAAAGVALRIEAERRTVGPHYRIQIIEREA